MKKKIIRYIKHPSGIREGITLLKSIGYPPRKISGLKSQGNVSIVISTLKKVISYKEKKQSIKSSSTSQARNTSTKNYHKTEKKEPDVIKSLRKAAKNLHKEHAHHHTLMQQSDDTDERFLHADKIMRTIIPQLDENYDSIRAYHNTGVVPEDNEAETSLAAEEVKKVYQSLKPRVSRLKRKIKNARSKEEKEKYKQEYDLKTEEIKRITLKYNLN